MAFALELLPALGLGLLLGRRWPGLAVRLAPPLVSWGVPFSVMALLLRSGLGWDTAQVALLALLAAAAALVLWSTLLALVTVPLWAWLLSAPGWGG